MFAIIHRVFHVRFFFVVFRVSISPDPTEKATKKLNISNESKTIDIEEEIPTTPLPTHRESTQPERTRLIVFGVAKIHKTRLLATLSGLKVIMNRKYIKRKQGTRFIILFSNSWKLKYLLCIAVLRGERKPDQLHWNARIPVSWVV